MARLFDVEAHPGTGRTAGNIPRPLVIQFGHLGDTVMLLVLLQALRERFGAPVDMVCPRRTVREFLSEQPDVGELQLIRSKRDPYWITPDQWRLVAFLRRRGAGPTWVMDGHDIGKGRWLARRGGIPDSLILDELDCPPQPGEHVVDRWWRFGQMTPIGLRGSSAEISSVRPEPGGLRVPSLRIAPAWRQDVDQWLAARGCLGHPLLVIQAGCKRTTKWGRPYGRSTNDKYWPIEKWANVIDHLGVIEPEAHVLLLGVPNEAGMNRAILKLARMPRAQNVAGDLPLSRLFALQERAFGMISVDTGPAHSAGALGCPLVVLFGTEDPRMYKPRTPTGRVEALVGFVDGEQSIDGIEPEQVIDAWLRLRQKISPRQPHVDERESRARSA
jgi:ADP-heptose:LPS heptosyltransferase